MLDAFLSSRPEATTASSEIERWLCNGALCTGVVALLVWLAARELAQLGRALGHAPLGVVAQLGAVAMVIEPYVAFNLHAGAGVNTEGWGLWLLALALGLGFWQQASMHGTQGAMANLATTAFIILYTGGLGSFLNRLRLEVGGASGAGLLLYSVFLVKMTDTGAYFTGRLAGRHKLIPWLSPNKTVEGFVGGLVVAILLAVGIGYRLHMAGWISPGAPLSATLLKLVVFGLLMSLLSTAGDLCESLIKRDAGAKDSGRGLPGLGGVLDMLDSPLLAAPAAWLFWTVWR